MFEHLAQVNKPKVAPTAGIQNCFKIMKLEGKDSEIFVPACIQFKIRNFTQVNFDNLQATVNGVITVNFLIFTQNKDLQKFLVDRLYFNPEEVQTIKINRRKKMERGPVNYIPLLFNKDDSIKIPTTRTKEFQTQSFKTSIRYRKGGANVEGIRIFHILRKQFDIDIIKNGWIQNFIAPFDFINLEYVISLQHMDVGKLNYGKDFLHEAQIQQRYLKGGLDKIKKVSFNLLRIQEPFLKKMNKNERVLKMSPLIAYSNSEPFGKYDLVDSQLEAYTHDQQKLKGDDHDESTFNKNLFEDFQPTQLHFKPFKYVVFKIPLFRYPIVDMMSIFIPIWLLSFVSVYIYFQTTEIMNRIVNVAGLMVAYAAIQPIVRENLPQTTTITLVDILIYSELIINILFLVGSIDLRTLTIEPSAASRWSDPLFITSLIIAILNVVIVLVLIIYYMIKKADYKADPLPRSTFSITDKENWTLTLLMERAFARYRERPIFFD